MARQNQCAAPPPTQACWRGERRCLGPLQRLRAHRGDQAQAPHRHGVHCERRLPGGHHLHQLWLCPGLGGGQEDGQEAHRSRHRLHVAVHSAAPGKTYRLM